MQRYANSLGNKYAKELDTVYKKIAKRIRKVNTDTATFAVLREVQAQIGQLLIESNVKAKEKIIKELAQLAKQESEWALSLLEEGSEQAGISAAITTEQALAIATTSRFSATPQSQVNLSQAFDNLGAQSAKQARQVISDGILTGQTNNEIADKLMSRARVAKHHATSLARTGTNLVSNKSRQEFYQQNREIIKQYQWVAALDSRTTLICASRDGEVYNFGEGNPEPPAHFNCRSTTAPVIDEKFRPKNRPPAKRTSRGADGGKLVSAKQTYGTWLRSQPASFQDEYFSKFTNGKEKAKLFRQGGLKIDKFIDPAGAEYSLSELKNLNPLEFAKTNI